MNLIPSSDGVSLATAVAVSGTFLLFVIGLQKSYTTTRDIRDRIVELSDSEVPSVISADETKKTDKKKKKKKKIKKRVHFAEDVADPDGYSVQFKRSHGLIRGSNNSSSSTSDMMNGDDISASKLRGVSMPANRVALYQAILRDRVHHRLGGCYS